MRNLVLIEELMIYIIQNIVLKWNENIFLFKRKDLLNYFSSDALNAVLIGDPNRIRQSYGEIIRVKQ